MPVMTSLPRALRALVGRYDPAAFEPNDGRARVRLAVLGGEAWDALLERGAARMWVGDNVCVDDGCAALNYPRVCA